MRQPPSLLDLSPAGGCGCKLPPEQLEAVLTALRWTTTSPSTLLGLKDSDDAAIMLLTDDVAVVLTVDFFTPIVDSPYDWGSIAAANAMSDVYAVGGVPRAVLNILAWPEGLLPDEALTQLLAGGADKVQEAGAEVIGGHSIRDEAPKFGMAVMGVVHPRHIFRNSACQPGDVLILTKPIGTGVISTAAKAGIAAPDVIAASTRSMMRLNSDAARVAHNLGLKAATDVSGFGLVGHIHDLARSSGLLAQIRLPAVPTIPGFAELATNGLATGVTAKNLEAAASYMQGTKDLDLIEAAILGDPQTSGGLILSTPATQVDDLLAQLAEVDICGAVIGTMLEGNPGVIELLS